MLFRQQSDFINNDFSEINNKKRAMKLAIIIAYTFIVSALFIIIKTPSAIGYEISIYSTYPMMFWFFILGSIIISIYIIILSSIYNSKFWMCGVFAIFICYTVILFLPSIRGYFFFANGSSDIFTHLADINIILEIGRINRGLIYPITHILAAELNLIASLSLRSINNIFAIFFTYSYVVSFFILGQAILKTNRGGLFLLAWALPLMYSFLHYAFIPFFFSLSLIPFILYCYHKKTFENTWKFSLLLIIFSLNIVFFHPFIVLMLLIVFTVFSIFYIYTKNVCDKPRLQNANTIIGILIVSFCTWYFSFNVFLRQLQKVIDALFYTGETTIYEYQTNALQSSAASVPLVVERFLKTYGSLSIYFLLAFLCIFIVYRKKRTAKDEEIVYSLLYIAAILFGLSQAIGYFVIFEPIRISSFAIVIATILLGIVFYWIFENTTSTTKKSILVIFMTIVICLASILGVLNLYDSPWKGSPNNQMTKMSASGLDWFLGNANHSAHVMNELTPIRKYKAYKSTLSHNPYNTITEINKIPTHFGYDKNESLSTTVGYTERYMITTELTRMFYLAVPENRRSIVPQYKEDDFKRLNSDPTVNKVYFNGEFELWCITSK